MAKRFTDNEKWKKPFIRGLKTPYKLLWLYILDECDHAGIWQVDFQTAEIKIGEKLNSEIAIEQFLGKIIVFDNHEKWLIGDFIDFQYGKLNPSNRVHTSVINTLEKYNLIDENYKIKALISPLQRAKDKDKEKDKDKDKEKEQQKKFEYLDGFGILVERWLNYKKTRKEKYASQESIDLFYRDLVNYSKGDKEIAKQIIEKSMSCNWAGIFEPKNKSIEPEKLVLSPIRDYSADFPSMTKNN